MGTRSPILLPTHERSNFTRAASQIFCTLFPTLHSFRSKTFLGKVVSIFATPAVLALTITLPVVISTTDLPTPHPADLGAINQHSSDHPSLLDFEEEGVERALTAEAAVEREMHELRFNKWLTTIQCALGPLFCALVLFSESGHHCIIHD
jgi:sodium/potassium/calcium exchanger 6